MPTENPRQLQVKQSERSNGGSEADGQERGRSADIIGETDRFYTGREMTSEGCLQVHLFAGQHGQSGDSFTFSLVVFVCWGVRSVPQASKPALGSDRLTTATFFRVLPRRHPGRRYQSVFSSAGFS